MQVLYLKYLKTSLVSCICRWIRNPQPPGGNIWVTCSECNISQPRTSALMNFAVAQPSATETHTSLFVPPHCADTEDPSSYFSPAFQIRHRQHTARVSSCRFELREEAIRSGCKLNFLVDTHPSPCHRRRGYSFSHFKMHCRTDSVIRSCWHFCFFAENMCWAV